jgi:DNA-binding transcriptional regulator YdaS (Cro superfamily)
MNDIRPDLRRFCSIAQLQKKLNRSSFSSLNMILSGKRRCPAETAIQIETATNGAITRSMLRPDLWPPGETNPPLPSETEAEPA